jgi:hypothetical protein
MLRVPGVKPGSRVRCPQCKEVFAPPAESVTEPTPASAPTPPPPAPPPAPAPAVTNDDDVFAKIAEADDPVAAAADVRKPKPVAGEPGNPLPLDDEPPAKARPTAIARKAPTASKGDKSEKSAKSGKKRRNQDRDEDENRTKGAISPVWLLGGLGALVVGVLLLGASILTWDSDKPTAEEAALAKREAELRDRERAPQREREAQQKLRPKAEPVKPAPVEDPPPQPGPDPFKPGVGPGAPPFEPPVADPPFDPPVKPNPVAPPEPAKPKPGPGIVRPAFNPAMITPTKAADKAEIKLPGPVDATGFGGGGRYVLLRIPSEKQVAVLDVCEGKIAKYIPIPEEGAFIAASNEHLFVMAPTDNVIQRWNLTTFQKERTAANPLEGRVRGLLMGHATDGPLFVVGPNKFLDAKTLKEVPLSEGPNAGPVGLSGVGKFDDDNRRRTPIRISADGRVFAWYSTEGNPSGLSTAVIGDREAKTHYLHTSVGAIIPGPDGTLFTAGGLYTPELKLVGEKRGYQYWYHPPVPAAHGRMYLWITPEDDTTLVGRRGAHKVQLKMVGENKVLADLSDLAGLDVPRNHNQTIAKGLQMHDRVFVVPDAKAVAVLHGTADRVTIHKLDIEAALDKAGIDFLFVTGRPGGAVCGAVFTYKPEVKSRKGGVKVKLDSGPEGMKVAADGTITWAVPANFADTSVSVTLTISDSSGQEASHTFMLPIASRP